MKKIFERPIAILFFIILAYFALFSFYSSKILPTSSEQKTMEIVQTFAQDGFFPKIVHIKELNDWGHIGYYVLASRVLKIFKCQDQNCFLALRLFSLFFTILSFWIFVFLAKIAIQNNRLNPIWISVALIVYALNPLTIQIATKVNYMPLLLFIILLSFYLFHKKDYKNAALVLVFGVLIDLRALLVWLSEVLVLIKYSENKIIHLDRVFSYFLVLIAAALPMVAYKGLVPDTLKSDFFEYQKTIPIISTSNLWYYFCLIPITTLFFTWNLFFRSRLRNLKKAIIIGIISCVLFFIFPIHNSSWNTFLNEEVNLGFLHHLSLSLLNENFLFLLLIPFIIGVMTSSLVLMFEAAEESVIYQIYFFLFLLMQLGVHHLGGELKNVNEVGFLIGDFGFLVCLPILLLFSLSETIVGTEGKTL